MNRAAAAAAQSCKLTEPWLACSRLSLTFWAGLSGPNNRFLLKPRPIGPRGPSAGIVTAVVFVAERRADSQNLDGEEALY
ncbi:hypothetical protein NL676_023024 [Syzygium grande]|nr:hypothetical protein NL676_023024 [Syzygium grande]